MQKTIKKVEKKHFKNCETIFERCNILNLDKATARQSLHKKTPHMLGGSYRRSAI